MNTHSTAKLSTGCDKSMWTPIRCQRHAVQISLPKTLPLHRPAVEDLQIYGDRRISAAMLLNDAMYLIMVLKIVLAREVQLSVFGAHHVGALWRDIGSANSVAIRRHPTAGACGRCFGEGKRAGRDEMASGADSTPPPG